MALRVPSRFADSGGAQTRCAQTVRAFFPESPALLGHTTRPEKTAEAMSPLLMADQLAEPVLILAEGLRQRPLINERAHPQGRSVGVGSHGKIACLVDVILFLGNYEKRW
ncbi:hypothetical protein PJI16_12835 [Nitrospira sp. MA-1]|nr:hypothetical protein [Nitrospira sp. MA-1]